MNDEVNFHPYIKGEQLKYDTETGSEIFEAKQNPDLLVKEFATGNKIIENQHRLLQKQLLAFIPKTLLVKAGKNIDSAKYYLIIEKVKRIRDEEYRLLYLRGLDEFLSEVVNFFLKNHAEKPYAKKYYGIAPDIHSRNLMFGITRSDPKPRLYLVDLFPTIEENATGLKTRIGYLINPHTGNYVFAKTQEAIKKLDAIDPYIIKP